MFPTTIGQLRSPWPLTSPVGEIAIENDCGLQPALFKVIEPRLLGTAAVSATPKPPTVPPLYVPRGWVAAAGDGGPGEGGADGGCGATAAIALSAFFWSSSQRAIAGAPLRSSWS